MESGLALYNALLKINVPHETARDVVSALERDAAGMATRSDIDAMRADQSAMRDDIKSIRDDIKSMRSDIDAMRSAIDVMRSDLTSFRTEVGGLIKAESSSLRELFEEKMGHLEARMTVRLGGIMAAGIGIMTTLLLLLRR